MQKGLSRTLNGLQELELFLNFICRGLHTCNVFYLTNRDIHDFCLVCLFTSQTPSQKIFSHVRTGLYGLNQY